MLTGVFGNRTMRIASPYPTLPLSANAKRNGWPLNDNIGMGKLFVEIMAEASEACCAVLRTNSTDIVAIIGGRLSTSTTTDNFHHVF